MDLKHYRNKLVGNDDERAVSPVIGVILMVAITVILAAVIAAFVLDIGDLDDSAPNAQFDWETNDDEVEVTHTSGDDIDFSNLEFQVDGDEKPDENDEGLELPEDGEGEDRETWTAGNTVTFTGVDDDDDEFQVIWSADGSSTVLTEYDT